MSKKVMVKKHIRHGVVIEAHEREVDETVAKNLTDKVKESATNKKKAKTLNGLLFGKKT